MRRAHHIGEAEERTRIRRLPDEDIDAGTGDLAGLDRFGEILLDDQAAAGAIDDAHAVLHPGDRNLVDDVARLLGERSMQRDEVGTLEQLVEVDLLDAELQGALIGEIGVVGDDAHPQPDGALGDDRSDIAAADDTQRLGGNLDAHEAVLLPLAGLGGDVGGGNLPGDGKHHGDGMLGRGYRIAEGRVHHDDAALGGDRHVDIVDTDAGAADDAQLLGGGEHLLGDLGGGADGEPVVIADHGEQLFLVLAEIGQVVDLDAADLEDLDGGLGQLVGNENTSGHFLVPFLASRRNLSRALTRNSFDCGGSGGGGQLGGVDLRRGLEAQAASFSDAFSTAKAHSSHCVRASRSDASIVAPAQMRKCGGASRW